MWIYKKIEGYNGNNMEALYRVEGVEALYRGERSCIKVITREGSIFINCDSRKDCKERFRHIVSYISDETSIIMNGRVTEAWDMFCKTAET